jgi:SAM-dependent methyltransferase
MINEDTVRAFGERLMADSVASVTALLAALGDRHGLFTALAGGPTTPAEMAGSAGIDERYAREWLAAMTAAGYVTHDPGSDRFTLPAEHAAVLASDLTPVGGGLQWMLGVAPALDAISEAFRTGKGVPADRYGPDLWAAMERLGTPMYSGALVQAWLPELPRLRDALDRGANVADIGCGSGRALITLAQAYPHGRYTGFDVYPTQVERARINAERAGVADRVRFEVRDAVEGLPSRYDAVLAFDVVHDAADPVGLLRSAREALTDGGAITDRGTMVILEISSGDSLEANTHPIGALYYGVSLLYCLSTSLAAGGPGLGSLGLSHRRLTELAREAGFSQVRRAVDSPPAHVLYEVLP